MALRDFTQSVDNMAVAPHVDPVEAERHMMTMLKRHGSLNAGEVVMHTAAEGWPLVDAGIARWAPARAPRRPVGAVPALQPTISSGAGLTVTRGILKGAA